MKSKKRGKEETTKKRKRKKKKNKDKESTTQNSKLKTQNSKRKTHFQVKPVLTQNEVQKHIGTRRIHRIDKKITTTKQTKLAKKNI